MINNISVTGGTVQNGGGGADYMGGLVGRMQNGTISNSVVSATVDGGGAGVDYMGGLVGDMLNGTISNSMASATVRNGDAEADRIGGITGRQDNASLISYCMASGEVSDSTAANFLSAFSGRTDRTGLAPGAVRVVIQNSISAGNASNNTRVAGFSSWQEGRIIIQSSLALGKLAASGGGDRGAVVGFCR